MDMDELFTDAIDFLDGLWLLFLNSLGSGDDGSFL
jgi:hypothetical protein